MLNVMTIEHAEHDAELGRLSAGVEPANRQRNELQAKLYEPIGKHGHRAEVQFQIINQRERLAQVDASPENRIA